MKELIEERESKYAKLITLREDIFNILAQNKLGKINEPTAYILTQENLKETLNLIKDIEKDIKESLKIKDITDSKYSDADIYQKNAMETCNIPYSKKEDKLRHAVFGLTSEAGEVAGILQKTYQGHSFDKEHMVKELGDCLWMIAEACDALDIKLSECMETNITKLNNRYPEGFDTEKSLHRDKNDI